MPERSGRPLRSRLVVSRRDLSSLSREKTIVLALLIQLFVAAFSSFLVVGLTSLYDPGAVSGAGANVDVAVVGEASDELVAAAREVDGLRVRRYPDTESAVAAFERDDVQAILEARRADGRIAVTATAPASSLRKTLVVVKVRAALEALERTERVERSAALEAPLVPRPPPVDASPYLGFTYTVLVPLLVFLPVFVSGSIAVDSVTEEVERGTFELLRVSPLSLTAIVDGKGLAAAALAPLQVGLWVLLLSANGIGVSHPLLVLVYATALSVGVVAAGVGLSLAVPDRQRAQLLYSVGVLGVFGGGVFLPEHPATTVALLAIDSPAPTTVPLVVGYCVVALAVVVVVRAYVDRLDPESL